MKAYLLKKGTRIKITEHYWGGYSELFTPVVDTKLDEDLIIPKKYGFQKDVFKAVRKKYGLRKTAYNSFIYKSLLEQVKEIKVLK